MRYVYIDESGNKDIDVPKDGATDFYVVAAAIVNGPERERFESAAEALAARHFNGSPIKSANVGPNDARRARVLADLSELPASYYALVIDKRRLHKERGGLRYARTFYKYILRIAQAELLASFRELDLTIDDHGSEEFKQSFLAYMDRHYSHDLFSQQDRRFCKSELSRGVQVADFVAGSLMKAVEVHDGTGTWPEFVGAIEPRLTFAGPWPRDNFPYHLEREREPDESDQRFNVELIQLGLHRAQAYLAQHERSRDADSRARVVTVQRLLSTALGHSPRNYLAGQLMRRHIHDHLPDYVIQGHAFMNRVIAPLRDAGVVIVASEKGYKIPVCMSEVLVHMNNTCGKVVPMVNRLWTFRDAMKLATTVDLFDREEYAFLARVRT